MAASPLGLVLSSTLGPHRSLRSSDGRRWALQAISARLLPEVLARQGDTHQTELPLATEGVLRYVWESRWGSVLIEVNGGRVFVNGGLVEAAPEISAEVRGRLV